jgi:UDP-N-acetyl-D-glucosamine dehydrogenase
VNVWEVIEAAATKPFGFMKFLPGPGLGGHCIPIDPHYLAWKMRGLNYKTRFIDLAGELNTEMPLFWVRKVAETLNGQGKAVRGASVLVLGVAYKRDIDDIRESPSLDVMSVLEQKGVRVSYTDPFVPALPARAWHGTQDLESVDISPAVLAGVDCVAILTDHTSVDYASIAAAAPLVVDSRNAIKSRHPHVFRLGAPTVGGPAVAAGRRSGEEAA